MAADADRNQIQVNAKRLKGYQRLERNTDPTPAEWPPDLVKNNLWAVPYLQPPLPPPTAPYMPYVKWRACKELSVLGWHTR